MSDNLVIATIEGIRIYAANTTDTVEEAAKRHVCLPLASAALGRTMTGALLLAATFKENERLTIKIEGDGPLGNITADAGSSTVRGTIDNPQAELPLKNGKIDVGGGVGKGNIIVTRFVGMKTPVSGSAELVSGEIAEDITNYLYVSEQIPTCISLGVLVGTDGKIKQSGGFFVQAMPDADDKILKMLEANIENMQPITVLMEKGYTPEDIINEICGKDTALKIHSKTEVKFQCTCSRSTVARMLKTLPKEDVREIAEDEDTEIVCNFCKNKYLFTKKEIQDIINS